MSEKGRPVAIDMGDHGLKKHDIKVSTVVFMIFCLVAAGCYGIEEMIPECGPGLTIVMLCVLPFVWGLPFGLVASELGSVRPQEGGYYKWVQEAFGEFWGFQAGWWRTISIYIDNTLYVILAGGYAASAWGLSPIAEFGVKLLMILIFTFINIRGVKDVGVVSMILSLLVILAFTMVAICGFLNWGGGTDISFQMTAEPAEGISDWFFYIAGGISIGMWMYSGYESMSTIAGEVLNPQVIPKGTLITIPLIMAVYIIPTVAGLGSLGDWTNWGTDAGSVGYAEVVTHFWGPALGGIFVVVAILAQCSIYNTYIASGSRGFFSLADDNLSPKFLVKCDKKHGVPYVAVLSVSVANIILCMLPFGVIIVIDVCLLVASYILVYLSAMVLRKRIPKEEYKFKIPGGYKFLCLLCIVPICVAIFAFFINGSDYFIGGMIGLLSGPVLYFIWRKKYGGLSAKDPVRYPKNKKTGLASGDTKKMAFLFLLMTIMNGIACVFMPWYEAWGTDDGWESADYFDGMFANSDVTSIVGTIQTILYIITAVTAVLTIVCFIISKKVETEKVSKEAEPLEEAK
ncbi:MAG: APC family permease [Anaerovoracaceae bacterium]